MSPEREEEQGSAQSHPSADAQERSHVSLSPLERSLWSKLGNIGSIASLNAKSAPEPYFTPLMEIRALASEGCREANAAAAMGIDWMTKDELNEAIPPAYTELLGRQLLAHAQTLRTAA